MSKIFGSRLRELRQESGLSMKKLGEKVGLSAGAICLWENGVKDISSENLVTLAKYFKVSTDYLLGLED